jgi:hypothetical protein
LPQTLIHGRSEVIYVHPETPMEFRASLPLSLPALIRRLPVQVDGWYAAELPDSAICAARIALIDVHWYLSLAGAAALVRRIRQVNKSVVVIAGGLTAGLFAEQLVSRLDVDWVVRGDAERPLTDLVVALLGGREPLDVPNLVGRDGMATPWTYRLSNDDIDANDYLYDDFFPAWQRDLASLHRLQRSWPGPIHPFLVPFRGCPLACVVCAGAPSEQRKLFRRGAVVRRAERLRDDLDRMEADARFRYVNALFDFVSLCPETYWAQVLSRPGRLAVQYEFARLPPKAGLEAVLSTFAGGVLRFSIDGKHTTSEELVSTDALVDRLRMVKRDRRFTAVLEYSEEYAQHNPDYRRAVRAVLKAVPVPLFNAAYWWTDFPRPRADGTADPATFDSFLAEPLSARFRYLYSMAGLSRAAERLLPPAWTRALRLSVYHATRNIPFMLNTAIRDVRDRRR